MPSRGRRPAPGPCATIAKTTSPASTTRMASAVVPGKNPPDSNDSQMTRPAAATPIALAAAASPAMIRRHRRRRGGPWVGSAAAGFSPGLPMSTDSDNASPSHPLWYACKRAVDLAGAGVGLLLLAPLFAVVAIAVRLDSRGPVFFRQERLGRDRRPFEVWKFRTMQTGASDAMHRAYIAELA